MQKPRCLCRIVFWLLDTGGPVKVTVNIYLRSISKIDDVNMVRLTWCLLVIVTISSDRFSRSTVHNSRFVKLGSTAD